MANKRFLRRILVPVDGSESSLKAEETAAVIAKKTQATVTVMHVIPYSLIIAKFRSGYQVPVAIRDEFVGYFEEHAEKVINSARDFFIKEGIKVKSNRIEFSDVAYSILKFSKDAHDMIIMGSRGENEKDPYALGSVTKKVARNSTCPTLIVKRTSSISNILVCVDGSEHSIDALNYAIKLGERMQSKVALMNVQDPRLRDVSPKTAEELSEHIMSTAMRAIKRKELRIERRVEFGVPQDMIVEVADKGGYDLIVLSSIGLGTIKRFLLGGVSDDVIHKATCSVLIVPPKK
nr:universal stress protein [Candidatus Njordarchaeum guaymaensis]